MTNYSYPRYRLNTNLQFYGKFITSLLNPLAYQKKPLAACLQLLSQQFQSEQILLFPQARIGFYHYLQAVLQKEDQVIISSYTLIDMVNMILATGAQPVLCDTAPHKFTPGLTEIKARVTDKTRVLVYTHLYGIVEDLTEIRHFCKQHQILLVEDCAQAVGCEDSLGPVGLQADAAVYSFGALKNIVGLYGGALMLKDSAVFYAIQKKMLHQPYLPLHRLIEKFLFCIFYEILSHPVIFSVFFKKISFAFDEKGHVDKIPKLRKVKPEFSDYAMHPIQAALILNQLPFLNTRREKAKFFAKTYSQLFEKKSNFMPFFSFDPAQVFTYLQYPVYYRGKNKDLKTILIKSKIDVNIDFFQNISHLEEFKQSYFCPNCEDLIEHLILFPSYSKLSKRYFLKMAKVLETL